MRRLFSLWDTIQLKLGTAITVLYVAAISLVGIEVMAILIETSLFVPIAAPLAPVIVIVLGTVALLRRRAIRRSAGHTIAPDHVARGARVRTRRVPATRPASPRRSR
jgi:hypothetical protein